MMGILRGRRGYGGQNDGSDIAEGGGRGDHALRGAGLRSLEHRALQDEGVHQLLAPEGEHERVARINAKRQNRPWRVGDAARLRGVVDGPIAAVLQLDFPPNA